MRDCADLSGTDFGALGGADRRFLTATEARTSPLVGPELEAQLGLGSTAFAARICTAFFRARSLDARLPGRAPGALAHGTLAGLGITSRAAGGDHRQSARPKKSPRAFCAPVRVPDEVYLVIAPTGGARTMRRSSTRPGTPTTTRTSIHAAVRGPLPGRQLDHGGVRVPIRALAAIRSGCARRLGCEARSRSRPTRAPARMVFLRRYAAKLLYELELHVGGVARGDATPSTRAACRRRFTWTGRPSSWLSDVDPFFYAARYLRAWALETHLATALSGASAGPGSTSREAGAFLRGSGARAGRRRRRGRPRARRRGRVLDFGAVAPSCPAP